MSDKHEHHQDKAPTDWKHDGVRVVPGDQLDGNVPSTPGMDRKAAINFARVGAQKLWAGTVHIHPDAKTGAHHHGPLESVIYVVKGRARMRWGNQLEFTAEAGPGDFIYVPPYVPQRCSSASCAAATARRSRSISISSRSRNPKPCSGSIRRIRKAASEAQASRQLVCRDGQAGYWLTTRKPILLLAVSGVFELRAETR